MKMTQGASRLASVKTALAFFSLSPSHLFSITLASTLRKVAPPSVATAFASIVLPVPADAATHQDAARGDNTTCETFYSQMRQ